MINIFIFFTQTLKKKKRLIPILHTDYLFFHFRFFYAKFLKHTFIERDQIIPICMFTIIYAYCIILTIDLTLKLMKFYLFIIYISTMC